ncbi:MAG: type II secretion system F family protein [bacterium]
MPVYGYAGKGQSGANLRGQIEAPSRDAALAELRNQGIIITALKEPVSFQLPRIGITEDLFRNPDKLQALLDYFGFTFVSQKDLAIFTRKFAQMLKAGLHWSQVFAILAEETDNRRLQKISRQMRDGITHGRNLTEMFGEHPGVFPKVFLSMIHAGEVAGRLDTIMYQLAEVYDKEVELRQSIMSKLYYPIGMLVVAMLIIGAMVTVVPRFIGPEAAGILSGFFSFEAFAAVGLFYLGIGVFLLWIRTKPGYLIFRGFLTYVPYIGTLLKKLSLIRFCRLMGAMWESGVPILEALEVSRETVAEPQLKHGIDVAADHIKDGVDMAESMRAAGVFPSRVLSLVATGEAAGDLEAMFMKIAEYYESEAEAQGHIVATVGYFVVYGLICVTVGFFVIKAWSGYFGMINGLIDEIP